MVSESDAGGFEETRSFKALAPGTLISHYRIIEKVGEGGMGVVYKAEDTKLDRTVALKFLPPRLLCDAEAKARFEHEAKSASALSHNNITTIYEIDEVEGRCFIAMEYIDGKSIKEMAREGSLSLDEIVDISLQIGRGLDAAHKKGVVHRDIKSDNIMVSTEGVVKIMDFGLAKLKGVTKLTKEGTTVGTLQYMSPEQLQGRKIDQRSDIFSSGVVFYEMITGRLPFRGEDEAAVIHSILNETPEPLARYKADVPDSLQRIVDKALSKDKEERYQHADELVADLKREKHASERIATAQISTGAVPRPSKRRFLRILVPVAAACIIALVIFVFEPFRVEMGPEKEAMATENSLAIMYFENLADREDPEKLGEIVTNLLITDLSESRYMSVVSGQRLYDILKLLGKEGTKIVDKSVASEVATRAQARWMLLGSILQVEPRMVLTSRLVEVETGRVVASQRITGEPGEQIFTMVDKLTVEIKDDLSLPAAAQEEPDRSVANVTTHSPDAYRHYIEALDYYSKYYFPEVQSSYERALEYDSTFAMAYYGLANVQFIQGTGGQKESIAKAVKYSDKVSEKERRYIIAMAAEISGNNAQAIQELQTIAETHPDDKEAPWRIGFIHQLNLQRPQDAIDHFERVIEIDPLHKLAYNQLAYCYNEIGDFDRSIWAINKYVSLAPDEPNPYDSRADLYARNGKIDQAIESYKKALEIKPDFYMSLRKLGHMYLFKREYTKAEICYQELASNPEKGWRSRGRTLLAYIPLYQGKLDEALEVLDDGLVADRMEQARGRWNANKHGFKAVIYAERKELNLALKQQEMFMQIFRKAYPDDIDGQDYYAVLLAENGDFQKAEEVAKALKKDIEEKDQTLMSDYWWSVGYIELIRGNFEASVTNFEKAVKDRPDFWCHYLLAEAYLEAGRLGDAVAEFEKILSRYDNSRVFNTTWAVKIYYLLGLAYEKSGWDKKAIEQYEEFLEIWKDGDPGIPEIEDARQRLAQLRQAS